MILYCNQKHKISADPDIPVGRHQGLPPAAKDCVWHFVDSDILAMCL
jgi:hypothetical protein